MTDKATIETKNPGREIGILAEYTIIGKVKPGHEKAIRDAIIAAMSDPRRGGDDVLRKVGIHTALHALFDNDTRLAASVWFENGFDKYFDDVITVIGPALYESWMQHLEGFPEKGLLGGLSGQAGLQHAKNWLAKNEQEVLNWRLTVPPMTLKEADKAQRVTKAFQKVLDHPEAEQALKHPALKPLLDEAAD